MIKDIFTKLRNKLSGRLLVLKSKLNKATLQHFTMLLHSRLFALKERTVACFRYVKEHMTWQDLKKALLSIPAFLRRLPQLIQSPNFKRTAPLLAMVLLIASLTLDNSGSLAVLTYTSPLARNSFDVAKMDLRVDYKNKDVTEYTELTQTSVVFDDQALYEPGYTQVVYFRIRNEGNVPFQYMLSAKKHGYVDSVSVLGNFLHLPDYLRFGFITAASEPELDRAVAQAIATKDMHEYHLGQYSEIQNVVVYNGAVHDVEYDETHVREHYAALVVYMPEYIGNEANYRGNIVPQVQLGVEVYAQQEGTPMK